MRWARRAVCTVTAVSLWPGLTLGVVLSLGTVGCVTQPAARKPAKSCPYRRPRQVPRAKRYPVR